MADYWTRNIIFVIGVIVAVFMIVIFGFNPLGITLSLISGIGICFLDYWVYYAKKAARERKQKYVICPRCQIPVEIESGICPKCNQRV